MTYCPPGKLCLDSTTSYISTSLILVLIYLIYTNLRHDSDTKNNEIIVIKDKMVEKDNYINNLMTENKVFKLENSIASSNMYNRRISDPLMPPLRTPEHTTPINIPTRGYNPQYQQIGVLFGDVGGKTLPLYGKPSYPGSRKWLYYTGSDQYNSVKLNVKQNNKNCSSEHGCNEIYDGDTVSVDPYGTDFKVNIYEYDKPRYIPHLF